MMLIDWDNEQRLGKMPDPELAALLGVTSGAVVSARKRRKIKSFRPSTIKHIDWKAEPRLGKMSDKELAEILDVRVDSIRAARKKLGIAAFISPHCSMQKGIDWDSEQRLGKMSDKQLARLVGVQPSTVARARESRNIPPMRPAPIRRVIDWTKIRWSDFANEEIARIHNIPLRVVRKKRKELGLPKFKRVVKKHDTGRHDKDAHVHVLLQNERREEARTG